MLDTDKNIFSKTIDFYLSGCYNKEKIPSWESGKSGQLILNKSHHSNTFSEFVVVYYGGL